MKKTILAFVILAASLLGSRALASQEVLGAVDQAIGTSGTAVRIQQVWLTCTTPACTAYFTDGTGEASTANAIHSIFASNTTHPVNHYDFRDLITGLGECYNSGAWWNPSVTGTTKVLVEYKPCK